MELVQKFLGKTMQDNTNENSKAPIEGSIFHVINVDKYTKEAKESFVIEAPDMDEKFRIKKEIMIELAEEYQKNNEQFSIRINNGYEASGSMQAGAGKAVKMVKTDNHYHCTFYSGEVGKPFDPAKVQSKKEIDLNRAHLESIFCFLLHDNSTKEHRAIVRKLQRSTLVLK